MELEKELENVKTLKTKLGIVLFFWTYLLVLVSYKKIVNSLKIFENL